MDRDHRLDVEDILRALVRAGVEVGVVLERETVEVADRVLQLLGQCGRVVGTARIGRRGWRRRLRGGADREDPQCEQPRRRGVIGL